MDSDVCPAYQSNSSCSATLPVNETSDGEVRRQTEVAPPGSEVEDVESYNLIEPPPLDWRSDSSSEAGSEDDLDDSSLPPAADSLDKASPSEPVLLPLSDTVAAINVNLQELVGAVSEPVHDSEVQLKEKPETVETGEEVRVEVLEDVGDCHEEGDVEERVNEDDVEFANRTSDDEDHSRIQSLLSQLQLMGEEPHPTCRTPPHMAQQQFSDLTELKACSPSLIRDDSTESTGLLFSESHQRDLLGMLQFTDISATPSPPSLPHRVDMDAVVSVSYSQEDAQRFWGHSGQQQLSREDSLPDEEYPEPVWMKMGEEPPEEDEAAAESEQSADHPSYKDVPGPCDPEDLLDGVIFGAKYLGSTQLKSEKNPSTNARMSQAQEAVDRIKAPEGESQPMTEVDLFISTQRIKVLTADTQEAMMDHALQMISYIADIGTIVVLMARRKRKGQDADPASKSSSTSSSVPQKKYLMICHVFLSDDAQVIAQAIGQAFGVAYQQFLQASGIKASDLRPGEYSDYLESQELYNGDLAHFSDSQNIRDVGITKTAGEILGLAVVESGWGSILPTVVVANLLHGGAAERCGELSIGDRIMSVNNTSMVGLPITTCQNIIRDLKSQKFVKLSIVHCPPVTMAIIRRPDPKFQLGFSVEDGIICSLMRGGIAERGGIRVGHRIIEINGQSVVATSHDKIIQILTNAVGEIHLKTMPASTYRLLTGQEQPVFL